jgi:hypothetical protein
MRSVPSMRSVDLAPAPMNWKVRFETSVSDHGDFLGDLCGTERDLERENLRWQGRTDLPTCARNATARGRARATPIAGLTFGDRR